MSSITQVIMFAFGINNLVTISVND